jgi:hypothetical protein
VEIQELILFDMNGRVIYKKKVGAKEINLTDIGIPLLKIVSNEEILQKKVIKW